MNFYLQNLIYFGTFRWFDVEISSPHHFTIHFKCLIICFARIAKYMSVPYASTSVLVLWQFDCSTLLLSRFTLFRRLQKIIVAILQLFRMEVQIQRLVWESIVLISAQVLKECHLFLYLCPFF